MEWPEFLESSNSQKPTFDTFSAVPYNNRGVSAQAYQWTPEEKQFFENTFSRFNDLGSQTFFEYVASKLPHKSMEEIKNHYITLFKDVEIENHVPKNEVVVVVADDNQHYQLSQDQDDSSDMEAATNGVQPQVENIRPRRRRGIPWTEEEHQLFLMGLNRFGKGDWKSISRYYVISKTPTQVASHAQKYFSRRNSTTPAERRRPSINDIQTVTLNPRTPTTIMNMTHPVNNDRLAYTNNYQVGSSSPPFRYPNNTFSGPTFSNNSNKDFGRFVNRGETSSISSFIMGQNNSTNNNNNNLRRPVSPRPFLSMYLSSAKKKNHGV